METRCAKPQENIKAVYPVLCYVLEIKHTPFYPFSCQVPESPPLYDQRQFSQGITSNSSPHGGEANQGNIPRGFATNGVVKVS